MPSNQSIDFKAVFYRLLTYFKSYKSALIVAFLALVIYGLIDASLIYYIQPLIDKGITGDDRSILGVGAVFVLLIFLGRGIASFISTYTMAWVGNHVIRQMRQQLFSKMLGMPVSHFDSHSSGSMISKITFDTEQVARATSQVMISLVREGVTIISLLAIMFYYSWQLSLVFFIVGPLIGLIISVVSKRFRKISKAIQTAMGQVTTSAEQMLKGHKIILAFSGKEKEAKRFESVNNKNRQQAMKLVGASASSTPFIQFVGSFAIAAVLLITSIDGLIDPLSAGEFMALIAAMGSLMRPLKQISKINADFQRGITACASVFEVLDLPDEVDNGSKLTERSVGDLNISKLNFSYLGQEKQALKDINLSIPAGSQVALVGRSGSGKSTLASLLMRFYDHSDGRITLDGTEINDYQLDNLRQQFALVSQQVVLFDDSIANNIAYGALGEVSEQQIYDAAKAAHVLEFSDNLPQGLNSPVGEDGANLSGGQRQRIAIARALLRNAPVLILDEATSALDTESERAIQDALEVLQQGRTSIVVAHRLSTIEHADLIVVMDEGQIIETGTHEALLEKGGAYSQLHNMQSAQG
ncbi:lipid A export permease/ATP-binding protein MsbA [Psychrobium sp. 1_MG-2023]|uniref:lipid A export permease/ATP-binding protein MsbA n=1 Tax=Psychrobium sp. 1_MG-2023 TaxID=3062624 RepID=UPI000C3444BD|nr:lipid A export permease/ATP-binding protein MsbA [Psychrobium sp. 1_MG-2023]MDP2560282.1 lipid A export permease/ATP-binding protein MsbA [Psychrobium sp. 1_MG-2023]PKF55399.1 lipid A export permease/ATP-binding protein MsbA [Alteromonadales bacterium alter-6D02]